MVVDYYAMLGADPSADRSSIEAALARCQPVWSSGPRNPKTKHTHQSYLDLIPEIRRTLLGDPTARAAYDAELEAERRALRDQRLDELQRLVKLRAAKGGLTVADRTLLREQADRLDLDPTDLDRLIEPIPPKPEAPSDVDASEPPPDVLDVVTRKQIRVALDHLRRLDLYDALGLVRDAPSIEIAARADAERRRWMQKTQVTAEKTAWLEVVSHAQSHLGTSEARARYDRTLALEAEERLSQSIAFAVKGLAKLDYGTRAALLDEGARQGITTERADLLISRGCRSLGVTRDGAPALILSQSIDLPRYLRCRVCSGLTEFAEVSTPPARPECRHCRAPLQWSCPSCKRVRWVDEPRCVCGFPLENLEPLLRHFEAAEQAHRAREYSTALEHLSRVQQLAPSHVAARKGIETIRRHIRETEDARSSFEQARAQRKLVAARTAVLAWARLAPADSSEVVAARQEVDRGLRMAESLVAKGRAIEDDPRAARALFEKALGIAADLDDAREGLRRCPPDPPSHLVAEFHVDRVRLRWTPPPLDRLGALKFRVVRKREGVPSQPNDGVVVAEVLEAEAEDRHVKPGELVGYAVFATRGEACSKSAPTAGPFMALPEVRNLRVEAKGGEVALGWTLPEHASGVRVVRNLDHRPAHDRDGDILTALPNGLVDRGLEDDRPYHYGIYVQYPMADGSERSSKGLGVLAVPHPPVEAPAAPSLTTNADGAVRLSWPVPARGSIQILRTTKPLPLNPGDRVPEPSTSEWAGDWLETRLPGQAEDPVPPPIGVCFYTPILAWSGMATIGHPARYSCVADPSELRAVRVGATGKVHLRWAWSPQATESIIVARSGIPPIGADDPDAIVASVSDEKYSRLRHFEIQLPASEPGPWHVAVFSVATVQGERVVSPGLEPSSRTIVPGPNPEVTVSYHLRRPRFPARAWTIRFQTEPADSPIPPTALVALAQTVPMTAGDGEIVARFPASRDGALFTIPAHINLSRQKARIFVDPKSSPDGQPPIRLRHPEVDPARI
jgi:hypothetical protein